MYTLALTIVMLIVQPPLDITMAGSNSTQFSMGIKLNDPYKELEDSWWVSQPPNYPSLPSSSSWACRLVQTADGGSFVLQLQTLGKTYLLHRSHISIFMMLDLQQLAALAMALVEPAKKMKLRHQKNVNFLDNLRKEILLGLEREVGRTQIEDVFLIRWILRVVHGLSNSKHCPVMTIQKPEDIYMQYSDDPFKWKPSKQNHFLSTVSDSCPVILKWVKDNKEMLLQTAKTIMSVGLSDHVRLRSSPDTAQAWANSWVDGIIFHMTADGFDIQEKTSGPKIAMENVEEETPPLKRSRGRPKKETNPKPLTLDLSQSICTRSQKRVGNLAAIEKIFQEKAITTSPTKFEKEVMFFYFS